MAKNTSKEPNETSAKSLALIGAHRYREAYDAIEPELTSVDPAEFATINIDLPTASLLVIGCAPRIKTFRAEAATLPRFDVSVFDKIDRYALASAHANTQYLAASTAVEPVQELVDELTTTREVLVSDVSALAKRKLLDGSRLRELQGTVGFKAIAFDVMLLTSILRANWPQVQGRTGVLEAELDRADQAADRLATAIALRDHGSEAVSAKTEARQRAFTLFVNAYDEVRRAVTYLRWREGDADEIAPSLYAGRGSSRKKPVAPADPSPGAPAPAQGNGAPVPRSPDLPITSTAPGMPGSDPFGR